MAIIPDPNTFDAPHKHRNLMANALRFTELGSQEFDDALEKEFRMAVNNAEEFMTAENGRVELTCEAVLLRDANYFDGSAISIARTKLPGNGVDETRIEGWVNGQG